ncbi:hypothetical protein PUN28_011858 [Cardiocondyla obscurior]|uniref:Uncharacterized protein n=1 Tax=Cardiocondyla obscurior TaxID=286306 RepID=A0AAW2FH76_9HYME
MDRDLRESTSSINLASEQIAFESIVTVKISQVIRTKNKIKARQTSWPHRSDYTVSSCRKKLKGKWRSLSKSVKQKTKIKQGSLGHSHEHMRHA